jgi:RNA polymerase sigma-70 factor, ECF subfamily
VTKSRGSGAATATASFAELCADEHAFAAWYERALPLVYGFVHGRTAGDVALAEEATADAFLEAIRARRSFRGDADPVTWICSIARNRLIDHYRSAARDHARNLRLIFGGLTDEDTAAWQQADDRDAVLASLAPLSPLERSALMLRYHDGYSVRETARFIGRTEAATESLLMRAREHIRAAFPGGLE